MLIIPTDDENEYRGQVGFLMSLYSEMKIIALAPQKSRDFSIGHHRHSEQISREFGGGILDAIRQGPQVVGLV